MQWPATWTTSTRLTWMTAPEHAKSLRVPLPSWSWLKNILPTVPCGYCMYLGYHLNDTFGPGYGPSAGSIPPDVCGIPVGLGAGTACPLAVTPPAKPGAPVAELPAISGAAAPAIVLTIGCASAIRSGVQYASTVAAHTAVAEPPPPLRRR